MLNAIDSSGLHRLAGVLLRQSRPADRAGALTALKGELGAYGLDGQALNAAVDRYFAALKDQDTRC